MIRFVSSKSQANEAAEPELQVSAFKRVLSPRRQRDLDDLNFGKDRSSTVSNKLQNEKANSKKLVRSPTAPKSKLSLFRSPKSDKVKTVEKTTPQKALTPTHRVLPNPTVISTRQFPPPSPSVSHNSTESVGTDSGINKLTKSIDRLLLKDDEMRKRRSSVEKGLPSSTNCSVGSHSFSTLTSALDDTSFSMSESASAMAKAAAVVVPCSRRRGTNISEMLAIDQEHAVDENALGVSEHVLVTETPSRKRDKDNTLTRVKPIQPNNSSSSQAGSTVDAESIFNLPSLLDSPSKRPSKNDSVTDTVSKNTKEISLTHGSNKRLKSPMKKKPTAAAPKSNAEPVSPGKASPLKKKRVIRPNQKSTEPDQQSPTNSTTSRSTMKKRSTSNRQLVSPPTKKVNSKPGAPRKVKKKVSGPAAATAKAKTRAPVSPSQSPRSVLKSRRIPTTPQSAPSDRGELQREILTALKEHKSLSDLLAGVRGDELVPTPPDSKIDHNDEEVKTTDTAIAAKRPTKLRRRASLNAGANVKKVPERAVPRRRPASARDLRIKSGDDPSTTGALESTTKSPKEAKDIVYGQAQTKDMPQLGNNLGHVSRGNLQQSFSATSWGELSLSQLAHAASPYIMSPLSPQPTDGDTKACTSTPPQPRRGKRPIKRVQNSVHSSGDSASAASGKKDTVKRITIV